MQLYRSQHDTRGANSPAAARRHNRRVLLQALRRSGSLSRAELARLSGLTPQAVANIVTGLMDDGLVREGGRTRAARGQPPIAIEIAGDGGYALGLRIDAKRYNAVAVDLAGTILDMREGDVPAREKAILGLIERLHARFGRKFSASRCLGIGLVTPGPFDTTWPGEPPPGAIPLLQTRALAVRIAEATGTDVFQENDAYAAAIGEKLYGAARDLSDFFYLFIGEGVGAGIVIDGESYRGSGGNGGEAGHMIVDPDGPGCYCGNRGCLGQYLSLQTLHGYESERGTARGREAWLKRAAPALSIALSSIENLFDPQMVILGGSAPASILEALVARLGALRPSVRQDMRERLRISTLGERSAALGASALPLLAATTSIALSKSPALR